MNDELVEQEQETTEGTEAASAGADADASAYRNFDPLCQGRVAVYRHSAEEGGHLHHPIVVVPHGSNQVDELLAKLADVVRL